MLGWRKYMAGLAVAAAMGAAGWDTPARGTGYQQWDNSSGNYLWDTISGNWQNGTNQHFWIDGSDADFGSAITDYYGGTIRVSGTRYAGDLYFQGGFALYSGALTLGNTGNGFVQLNSSGTTTIITPIVDNAGGANFTAYYSNSTLTLGALTLTPSGFDYFNGSGTINITGALTTNSTLDISTSVNCSGGGTGSSSAYFYVNSGGLLTISGGTFSNNGSAFIGLDGGSGGTGAMTVSAGTYDQIGDNGVLLGDSWSGHSENGTLNINGTGLVKVEATSRLLMASGTGGSGTINLGNGGAGGELDLGCQIITSQTSNTFNFNGGTLKLLPGFPGGNLFSNPANVTVNIQSGGGTIDLNGQNVTISNALTTSGGGGLTVKSTAGGGTLTLGAVTNATSGTLVFGNSPSTNLTGTLTSNGYTMIYGNVNSSGGASITGNIFNYSGGGQLTISGGTFTVNAYNVIAYDNGSGGSASMTVSAGVYDQTGYALYLGYYAQTGHTGNGVLNVNGTGVVKVEAGCSLMMSNYDYAGTTGTINLGNGSAGGELDTAAQITDWQPGNTFNFNGGTLKLLPGFSGGNLFTSPSNATTKIQNGGAIIDLNGQSVTITNNLANAGTGGLTVNSSAGGGTLTLTGSSTYTGATIINGGTVVVAGPNSPSSTLTYTSGVTINNGGTLVAQGSNSLFGYGGPMALVTINAGGKLTMDVNSFVSLANVTLNGGELASNGLSYPGYGSFAVYGTLTVTDNSTLSATNFIINGPINVAVGKTLNVTGTIAKMTNIDSFVYKTGGGTMVLSNANTYSGATTIVAGTLQLGTGTAGQDGSISTGGVSNNGALVYNLAGNQTAGYGISGTGTLTKSGPGTLTLLGGSSYGGSTTVTGGTLQLATHQAYQFTDPTRTAGQQTWSASIGNDFTVAAGQSVTITQLGFYDSGGDGLASSHVVEITDNVNGSTVYASATVPSGASATLANGFRFVALGTAVTLGPGTYRIWGDQFATDKLYNMSVEGAPLTPAGPTDAGGNSQVTYVGTSYYNTTVGFPALTGGAAFGPYAYVSGSFRFLDSATGVLPAGTSLSVAGGATFDLNGVSQTIGGLSGGGTITSAAGASTLTVAPTTGTSTTFSGVIQSGVSVIKAGAGTLVLSGTNLSGGSITITDGELDLAGAIHAPVSGSVFNFNGGTLKLMPGFPAGNLFDTPANVRVNIQSGGVIDINGQSVTMGAVTFPATTNVTIRSSAGGGTLTNDQIWIGCGSGTGGTATLTVSGGTLDMGYLLVVGFGADPGHETGILNINGSGVVRTANGAQVWMTAGSQGELNATGIINLGNGPAGGELDISCYIDVQLPGNTFNFNGGTLKFLPGIAGNLFRSPGWVTTNIQNGGAVIDVNGQSVTISNALLNAGTGGLTVNSTAGGGTLTLSGASTYTGPTTVNAGTLQAGITSMANASGSFGVNSAVTLANAAGAALNITGFNTLPQ